jgi:hypothetical protein
VTLNFNQDKTYQERSYLQLIESHDPSLEASDGQPLLPHHSAFYLANGSNLLKGKTQFSHIHQKFPKIHDVISGIEKLIPIKPVFASEILPTSFPGLLEFSVQPTNVRTSIPMSEFVQNMDSSS